MKVEDWFMDKLPADAQILVDEFEEKVAALRRSAAKESDAIREKQQELQDELAKVERRVEDKIPLLMRDLLGSIKPLQDKYAKAGMLDEALAIRDRIRQFRGQAFDVRPDPGSLHVTQADYGKSFLYEVTGSAEGTVYGTDIYTCDCNLAAAAVHAGVLRPGEKGIIRVSILETPPTTFSASTRNGVTSYAWSSSYPAFRVARA